MSEKVDMRRGGGAPVPWRVWTGKRRLGMPTEAFDKLVARAPIETVDIAGLVATQPTVDPDEVKQFVESPPHVPKGARGSRGLPIDHPIVLRRDGEDRIIDGHHRLTAALARGEKTAAVRYVDGDAVKGLARWAVARGSI